MNAEEQMRRAGEFHTILSKLTESDLKSLCYLLECYPYYGDESPAGLARSIWGRFVQLQYRAAAADRMEQGLILLGVKT